MPSPPWRGAWAPPPPPPPIVRFARKGADLPSQHIVGLVNFTVCEKRREGFSPSGSRLTIDNTQNSEKNTKLTNLSQKQRESLSFLMVSGGVSLSGFYSFFLKDVI
jgi:hypothetical protein